MSARRLYHSEIKPLDGGQTKIQQFNELITRGIEAWVEAGQLLCEIVKANPDAYTMILSGNPHLTSDILEGFERIGRKEIYPYLLIDGSPGAKALAALSYDEQVKLYTGRVRVLTGNGLREKRVSDLTPAEVTRLFDADRIRSIEQQRSMCAKRKRYPHESAYHEPAAKMNSGTTPDPLACVLEKLEAAHYALMAARQALNDAFPDNVFAGHDLRIASALKSVGQLRFAINEESRPARKGVAKD